MLNCYYMNIVCGCSYEQLQSLRKVIPDNRIKKADKLKDADMAVRHMISSAFLQYGLSMALQIPVKEISYQYEEGGRPMLSESVVKRVGMIDFNLSHSAKCVVLAVSDSRVGIDVERRRKNRIAVAERCFHEEEYRDITAVPSEEERDKRFLEYWTMKESYVKRSGEGLRVPLDSFLIKRREDALSYVENEDVYFATVFCKGKAYCVSICSNKKKELERIQECCHNSFSEGMNEIKIEDIMKEMIQ